MNNYSFLKGKRNKSRRYQEDHVGKDNHGFSVSTNHTSFKECKKILLKRIMTVVE